jgi:hypothetical protein
MAIDYENALMNLAFTSILITIHFQSYSVPYCLEPKQLKSAEWVQYFRNQAEVRHHPRQR